MLEADGRLLAALLSYALGRSVGRPLLRRLLGRRFAWLTGAMEDGGISLLLAGRLIPIVPFALLGYAAGATHISLWRFAWTTVLGYLPLTIAVTYLGSQAQTFSASNPLVRRHAAGAAHRGARRPTARAEPSARVEARMTALLHASRRCCTRVGEASQWLSRELVSSSASIRCCTHWLDGPQSLRG